MVVFSSEFHGSGHWYPQIDVEHPAGVVSYRSTFWPIGDLHFSLKVVTEHDTRIWVTFQMDQQYRSANFTFSNSAPKHLINISQDKTSETTELPPALGTSLIFLADADKHILSVLLNASNSVCTRPLALLSLTSWLSLKVMWWKRTEKFSPMYMLQALGVELDLKVDMRLFSTYGQAPWDDFPRLNVRRVCRGEAAAWCLLCTPPWW